jgi:hypothetical protein
VSYVVYDSITMHLVSVLDGITVPLIGVLDIVIVHVVSIYDSWLCPTVCFMLDRILFFCDVLCGEKKMYSLQNKQVSQVWHHKHYASIY